MDDTDGPVIILHICVYVVLLSIDVIIAVRLNYRKNRAISEASVAFILLVLGFTTRILEYGIKYHELQHEEGLFWLEHVFVVLADTCFLCATVWIIMFWLKVLVVFLSGSSETKIDTSSGKIMETWQKISVAGTFLCNIPVLVCTVVYRNNAAAINIIVIAYHVLILALVVAATLFGLWVVGTVMHRLKTGKYSINHAKTLVYFVIASVIYSVGVLTSELLLVKFMCEHNTTASPTIGMYVAFVGDVFYGLIFILSLGAKPLKSVGKKLLKKYFYRRKLTMTPSIENIGTAGSVGTSLRTNNVMGVTLAPPPSYGDL